MSRYLVDTQVWLWMQTTPERLRATTLGLIENSTNELLLSAASAWEIAIKYRLGKLWLPQPPAQYVPERLRRSRTTALGIEHAHVLRTAQLPDHHRDPFDRILVAQALTLDVPIISADEQLTAYDVGIVPA